ncbi:MAG: helix-turn-helix domain-containing protein [Fimbriimonadaceae bacterium]|nr:helix-turn-helix domain-containing protein [Fimbriimonadaceae bacterium]
MAGRRGAGEARKGSPDQVSAKELASAADEDYNTIDHWTNCGLLPFTRKGRKRSYPRTESLYRCVQIRSLQNEGHSLTTIRGMLQERG